MTAIKDLRTSTILSPVPPANAAIPDPHETAPRALKAARALKGFAADQGITSSDDLLAVLLCFVLDFARDNDLDVANLFHSLCPAMFAALNAHGAPRSPSGPWNPLAFNGILPAEELGEKSVLFFAITCIETIEMGFELELWGMGAIWLLVALLVVDFGMERAAVKLSLILRD